MGNDRDYMEVIHIYVIEWLSVRSLECCKN
jgi:hypothetical protein